jgi:pimeloyl-ACP methyl ester carboxylesterase
VTERDVEVEGRTVMVRDAGDPEGFPLVYFHGTPGSRLDVTFGDELSQELGVRVISFDRPGHGRSEPASYTLESVARDAAAVADNLGVDRFATLGWSGGGPFALAAAAVLGERVTRVGLAGANAPFQEMPGAMDAFTDNDRAALAFLPEQPGRAAEQFRIGNEETLQGLMSVRDDEGAPWIDWMWGDTDPGVVSDPVLRRVLYFVVHEGLRQGPMGICWDNVAWVGAWGFGLDDVRRPVQLWYGEQDQMAPPVNGQWLRDHLPDATLTVYTGEGHLVPMRHWPQILQTLAVDPRGRR